MILTRYASTDEGTPGVLTTTTGRIVCMTLELPWRNNARGRSCIPTGEYRVEHAKEVGRFADVYHLQRVQSRAGILIHAGNWAGDTRLGMASDSEGCILLGMLLGPLRTADGVPQLAAIQSRDALKLLHAATGRKPFDLVVRYA